MFNPISAIAKSSNPLGWAQTGLSTIGGLLGGLTESPQEKLMKQQAYAAKQMLPFQLKDAATGNQMNQAQLQQFQQMSPLELQMARLQNQNTSNEMMRQRSLNPLAQQGMTNIMDVLARKTGPGAVMDQASTDQRKTIPTGAFGF